jgi:DNA primase small subunit
VRNPAIIHLDSSARREIVDYITATGLEMDQIFRERTIYGDAGRESAPVMRISRYDNAGWGGKINRWIISFLRDLSRKNEKEALETLKSFKGIGDGRAVTILKMARDPSQIELIKKGNLIFKGIPISFWKALMQKAIMDTGSRVDEPVTADIKRLIRLPTSLHGGTGFRVVPLTLNALDDFNPLNDAVVFGDDVVPANVTKASDVVIKGKEYKVPTGRQKLPAHLAIFLMCRGVAEYGS